jgi:chromatin structure-remodeling complex subunit RSC1/2
MINKRLLPDYFEVIKEPIAFSTIRVCIQPTRLFKSLTITQNKILKKLYTSWSEFIRDFALIAHNAQVYNRPSAPVYSDAVALRELLKVELQKLVDKSVISKDVATLPDFGEIPPVDDSPPPDPQNIEEVDEEEEEDEDEDEDDEDSDDDGARKRRRRGRRSSAAAKRDGGKAEDKDDPEAHKKRGRPPKVHTPMEARINTVLKGLRKFKNSEGDLKILPFEKLPDKTAEPGYYLEIKNPMAMDLIKRKAKRKKYQSVEQALKDLELMFENAKLYNTDDSVYYQYAVDLQKEARILADQEKKKPDSDYYDEDGRLPVPHILHNGEVWKVGKL